MGLLARTSHSPGVHSSRPRKEIADERGIGGNEVTGSWGFTTRRRRSQIGVVRRVYPCAQCGDCEAECATGALRLGPTGPRIDDRLCAGCRACIAACPEGALVTSAPRNPEGGWSP